MQAAKPAFSQATPAVFEPDEENKMNLAKIED